MTYIPTINTARIANDAVTGVKVLDGTLTNADINAAAAIAYSKLNLSNSIVSADIVNATITGADIAATTITAANVAANTLTAAEIAADAITSSELADNAVDTNALQASSVTAAKLAASLAQIAAANASAGDITASSQKITNLADGANPNDAVNYSQLIAVANGIVDWKNSVRVVTAAALPAYTRTANVITSSANVSLNTAGVDGVTTLAATNRILLKDGAAGSDNGIYEITAVGSGGAPFVLTRTTDADTSAEVTAGMAVMATEGTLYNDSLWLLGTADPITLNTTSLSFVQLPSLTDLVAGAGLTKTGNTLDVGAGTGILSNANDVAIDTTVVPRKGVTNTFTAANVFSANTTLAGVNYATSTKVANYTVDLDLDHTILVDSSGGAFTVTLPASHTAGDTVVVKDSGGATSTNAVLVDPADADTIDGASTYSIASNYESIELRSNGTNWFIV